MSIWSHKALFASLLVCVALPLCAQNNGTLSGSVIDKTGAYVPNAAIELRQPGGGSAMLQAKTSAEGSFSLSAVKPGTYELTVEALGFSKLTLSNVEVSPGRENTLQPIRMEIAGSTQTVEVSDSPIAVQSNSFEVATTITSQQVANLPVLDRQVSNLFSTQAGVASNPNGGSTVIDGLRSQMTNVTLDGINVQDNFIRLSGLDYLPNKLTIAQVSEFTISSANAPSNYGIGATQITMTTPSGTNEIHGTGYYYNRNSALSANDWFANQNGTAKPFLNLNQMGGTVGGPVKKDKLFFYLAYEAYRLRQTSRQNDTVPTSTARQGMYTFTDGSGTQFNVLQAGHATVDPYMAKLLGTIPLPNNSQLGDGLNTAGYQFNASSNETRDNAQGRIDYVMSPKNIFFGTYIWNRDLVDRPDVDIFYSKAPPITNNNSGKFLSVGWRWTPTPRLTNELRGGFNRTPGLFDVSYGVLPFYISNSLFNAPAEGAFAPQGRYTNTYAVQDNANLILGKHNLSFGYQQQNIRIESFNNNGGIGPIYTLGFGPSNPNGLTDIPGATSDDINSANTLLATLGGVVSGYQQTFNVKSRTSGFVSGAPNTRNFQFDTYSGYVADKWKLHRTFSLSLGVRYDYYTPLNERDSLYLTPVLTNNNYISTLLSNATLDFGGNSAGRPFYKASKLNFAPNAGFAWDIFGDGKTAIRGGYSLTYVNDDLITAAANNLGTNAGLSTSVSNGDVIGQLSTNLPKIVTPALQVPRTFRDNYLLATTANAEGMIDPGLKTPYVQQWSIGVQQEYRKFIFDARYVGNHGLHELRAIDFNQVQVGGTPFLADFQRARNNLLLSLAAGRGNNPNYNSQIAGSVPLQFLPKLPSSGLLNNSTVRGQIARGEVGQLGNTYQQAFKPGQNGGYSFFPSRYGFGMNALTSASYSYYDAVQLDVRRRLNSGQQVQLNYTFSKAIADANGDLNNSRFEPFSDVNNGLLDKSRAPFDQTQALKANYVLPIPMGKGHRLSGNGLVNRIIGDWTFSGFLTYQSGTPYSIVSRRGTYNRGGSRATYNTADIASGASLNGATGFFMTKNGPYFVNPSAIDPNSGRGVASDGAAPFAGQVFSNPVPGAYGLLGRRIFSGPWFFNWDAQLAKKIPVTERVSIDFQAGFYNMTNHPSFGVGTDGDTAATNYSVNGTNFGRIVSTVGAPRIIQFGAYVRF